MKRLVLVAVLILLAGCSPAPDDDSNQPPTVEISSSPVSGDTTSYTAVVSWTGEDPDGAIAHFEWSVDPDAAFSEEDIAKGGPGIVALPIPGRNGAPDTTRIVKNGGASFDWIHTRDTARQFLFSTPNADSLDAQPTGRFEGMHAVYVRAIDNDGAYAVPAKLAFTSETVAPISRIVRPNITLEISTGLGPSVTLEWSGFDPDGRSSDLHYQMKVVRLDALDPPIPILQAAPAVLLRDPGGWISMDAASQPFILSLATPAEYLLGIRAVDAAGAVEPFLDFGRNAFKFQAFPQGGRPEVILRTAAGALFFRGNGNPVEVELVAGTDFHVRVQCNAESYGEACDAWRWALDLADRDDPEGWSDWTTDPAIPEIRFPGASLHVFYLDARDKAGGTTRAAVVLHVVDAPFDREVLLVDDSFNNLAPTDAQNDAFWSDLVSDYVAHSNLTRDQFFNWEVHGEDDRGSLQPIVPSLSELLRYKLLVWDVQGSGYNNDSALLRSTVLSPRLFQYLNAGGKVWLSGTSLAALYSCPYPYDPGACADLEAGGTSEFSFCRNFGLCTDLISKASQARDALVEAIPYPGIDLPVLGSDPSKGPVPSEAVLDPILEDDVPDFVGDIDSVFAQGAAGPRMNPPLSSNFEGKPVAIRWHDPDPNPRHGRTAWFGFSPYFFYVDQCRETFRKTIDWFREEAPPKS